MRNRAGKSAASANRSPPCGSFTPIANKQAVALRQALIDDNTGHVNVVVCEADYKALKRGIEYLQPPVQ
jgi:hypothetical protein